MNEFNVLSRSTSVRRHLQLLASAGTGKTFAIENIVTRLLIEGADADLLTLEKILVVTFTKAATRDLKERIRSHLEKTLAILNHSLLGKKEISCPDYLVAILEQGERPVKRAKSRLESALFSFDQANIFTIHGFCYRSLKSYPIEARVSIAATSLEEEPLVPLKVRRAISDFVRTELTSDVYTTAQLRQVLQWVGNDSDLLQERLYKIALRGTRIRPPLALGEQLIQFQQAMQTLKSSHGFTEESVLNGCLTLAPYFKELADRKKNLLPEVLKEFQVFAHLFSLDTWGKEAFDLLVLHGVYPLQVFHLAKLKKEHIPAAGEILAHPMLTCLKSALEQGIEEARSAPVIFSRMACECQKFLQHYQREEELFLHDDLLAKMKEASQNFPFAEKVAHSFSHVIVDEFQDTDPFQWEILSALFLNSDIAWKGCLQLVGDPKQSIYAFRQADIYTYLAAGDALGITARATLDTNYRSQPSLIQAINACFCALDKPFSLPRINSSLPYSPVKAGSHDHKIFNDGEANFQFLVALDDGEAKQGELEAQYFFPAIAKELMQLVEKDHIRLDQCAVLVSDRYQAKRLKNYLKQLGIASKMQRADLLSESKEAAALSELLEGILGYRQSGPLKRALGGCLIEMNHDQLESLDSSDILLNILTQCEALRSTLIEKGIGAFYHAFMDSKWKETPLCSVREAILSRKEGKERYKRLEQLVELLMAEEASFLKNPRRLIEFLAGLDDLAKLGDERLNTYFDPDEEGVRVLTVHSSKGLEFDIVFSLGLISQKSISEDLILVGDKRELAPANKKDAEYQAFCRESDAEKMRQLYVALTRAKYRLYVPTVVSEDVLEEAKESESGKDSPMELFLQALRGNQTEEVLRLLQELVGKHSEVMQIKVLEKDIVVSAKLSDKNILLLPPEPIHIPTSPLVMQSFTSLQSAVSNKGDREATPLAPTDYQASIKNEHTLPSSKETGVLLHHLFEKILFEDVLKHDHPTSLIPWVKEKISSTPYVGWEEVVAGILYSNLKAPLPHDSGSFCLADVDPKRIFRETEFAYPAEGIAEKLEIGGVQAGYIKGVIDLFFEHRGKYYLIDWKSNWLGPEASDYTDEKLALAMKQSQYDLQAKLYAEALSRYLALFAIDFESAFGGAFYFFVRGVPQGAGIHQVNVINLKKLLS